MLIYSARTEGYKGEAVKGVDRLFEATGNFVSAVFRVMPHANDQERFKRIVKQMQSVKVVTLSEYRGGKAKPIDAIQFPPVGKTDADVFGNNLLEVMQFVFNHTTFDPTNELDKAVLSVYAPLGIVPGRAFDPARVAKIDGGIAIYIASQKPKDVPEENRLPINRKNEDIGAIMRVYVPDLEKLKTWSAPKAEKIK